MTKTFKHQLKRGLASVLALTMCVSMLQLTVLAEEGGSISGLCEHHTEHTTDCGYAEAVEGGDCIHAHDDSCGYAEAVEGAECTCETENDEHTADCEFVAAIGGQPCNHQHDETCGYVEAKDGAPCAFVCELCEQTAEDGGESIDGVTLVIDGETSVVPYTNGAATIEVNGGDKTIVTVAVDDEIVLDQYRTIGQGEELLKNWAETFEDGKQHKVEVTLGYKLTVKTRYVNSDDVNGNWVPNGTPDSSDPTYYTLVVPAGSVADPIALLPLPSEDGKYPLRLLDYVGVSHPGMGYRNIGVRYVTNYEPGSDDPDVWVSQSSNTGSMFRYVVLNEMVEKDASVELRYNYSKIATFVNVQFEKVNGEFVPEDYSGGSVDHLKMFHDQDTLVNEVDRVTFDPKSNIFGTDVKYPDGTAAENYLLMGAVVCTEHNGLKPQYFNYYLWSDAQNKAGVDYFKKETGLTFDPETGKVDGTLINAIDARNILIYYYYGLVRPVIYDANGGVGEMAPYNATTAEEVVLTRNTFSRDGYVFTGWNTEADGSGTDYQPGSTLKMGYVENVTLYAQWKAAPVTYTVTYTDGVDGEEIFADQSTTVESGDTTPAFDGTPTRSGYTFTGWSPEVAETVTGDVTYVAQWRANSTGGGGSGSTSYTLTINYEYADGSRAAATVTRRMTSGTSYNVTSPVIEGYTASQTAVSGTMPASNVTVTVVYTADTVEIPEENPPLSENPDVEIPDENPPLSENPDVGTEADPEVDPEVEIPDESVPLDGTPKTGDNSRTILWGAVCVISMAGLVVLFSKKWEDKER